MKPCKATQLALGVLFLSSLACGDDGGKASDTDAGQTADASSADASDMDAAPGQPSCSDEIRNQDESDVDCGGDECEPCEAGQSCEDGDDCQSALCESSLCVATFSVGGSVSGLDFPGLILQNNDGDDLQIDQSGNFTFATKLQENENYTVGIAQVPEEVTCEVENASGSIANADISDVAVTCFNRMQVSTAIYDTCALARSGEVKCWGSNDFGQLGLGDTEYRGANSDDMGKNLPLVDLGSSARPISVTGGYFHNCALFDDGSVKCWGANGSGRLGLGDNQNRGNQPGQMGDDLSNIELGTNRKAISLSAGAGHTCALLDDASVKCWGNNGSGELGQGDTENRGDNAGEMGDSLASINFGEEAGIALKVRQLTSGEVHNCALLENGSVKCWGQNGAGQLGLGDTETRGDEAGEMGDALPAVDLGAKEIKSIHAHLQHTCALFVDHSLKCWGSNNFGQLGLGDTENRGDDIDELGANLPDVDLGQGRSVKKVGMGMHHTCVILDDDSVKCWGQNQSGQLGLGDTEDRGDGANEMGDNLPPISLGSSTAPIALTGGNSHNCVVFDNDTIKCWGANFFGQLGLGDTQTRGDDPDEMGANLLFLDLRFSP